MPDLRTPGLRAPTPLLLLALLLPAAGLSGCSTEPLVDDDDDDDSADDEAALLPLGDALAPLAEAQPTGVAVHLMDIAAQGDELLLASFSGAYLFSDEDDSLVQLAAGPGSWYHAEIDGPDYVLTHRSRGLRRFRRSGDDIEPAGGIPSPEWSPEGLVFGEEVLWVAAQEDGLVQLARDDLSFIGSDATHLSNAIDVTLEGELLFVADRDLGLVVLQIEAGAPPSLRSITPLSGAAQAVVVRDGVAYLAASSHLDVIDVRDPDAPALVWSWAGDGVASRLALGPDTLLLANWFDSVLFDLSEDPLVPRVAGREDAQSSSMSVAVVADRGFVGDWETLRSFTLDPTVGSAELAWPAAVDLYGEEEASASVRVENQGDRTLRLSSPTCADDSLTLALPDEAATLELEPGGLAVLSATAAPATPGASYEATCSVQSNDVDEPSPQLLVQVNPPGLGVGDVAPDFTLPDLSGALHSLSNWSDDIVVLTLFSSI